MDRQQQKNKTVLVKDRQSLGKGSRMGKLSKGGAGKGNWGTDGAELEDLDIRVGSPFEDPKLHHNMEANEPKVRVAGEEEISMTAG